MGKCPAKLRTYATITPEPAIPVQMPSYAEIESLAEYLHHASLDYSGKFQGWPVRYEPEHPIPPPDSRLTFTPASFFIGVWPLWFVSYTWENGKDEPPHISYREKNLMPA